MRILCQWRRFIGDEDNVVNSRTSVSFKLLASHLAESVEQTRSTVLELLMLRRSVEREGGSCCWRQLSAAAGGKRRSSWSVSPWDTSSSCSWVSSYLACSSSRCTCTIEQLGNQCKVVFSRCTSPAPALAAPAP